MSKMYKIGENLFDASTNRVTAGKYISENGIATNSSPLYTGDSTYNFTDYIPVETGKIYSRKWTGAALIKQQGMSVSWYNSNKTFLSRTAGTQYPIDTTEISDTFTAPTNAAYAILNFCSATWPNADVSLEFYDTTVEWRDTTPKIYNTSTDTLTTLPAVLYPNATTAVVGLKGNTTQSGTNLSIIDTESYALDNQYYKDTRITDPIEAGTYTISFYTDSTSDNLASNCSLEKGTSSGVTGDIVWFKRAPVGDMTVQTFTITEPACIWMRFVRTGGRITGSISISRITLSEELSPTNTIYPSGCGDKTANLFYKIMSKTNIDAAGRIIINGDFDMAVAKVAEGETYSVSGVSAVMGFFVNEPEVGSQSYNNSRESIVNPVTIPQGVNYVAYRAAARPNVVMLNIGETALTYEPYGNKIPISSNSITTPVYLGEVESTRQIKKLVFDGTESFTLGTNNQFLYINNTIKPTMIPIISSHYKPYDNDTSDKTVRQFMSSFASATVISIRDTSYANTTVFKAYLAQQYAAGTPVTVYYVLATEETGIVDEPLMKIGDYADTVSGISIPVTAGGDTLSVGTTVQPSEVTVNYKGWHPVQSVHEAEVGNNLFNYTTMATSAENSYLNPDGTIGTSNDWNISDYIPCDGTTFAIGAIGGNIPAFCLYDGNKQYITGKSYNTGGASSKRAVDITSQSTAKYIRFSYCKASGAPYDNLSAIMLNKGISLLPYEPYGTHWD